MKYGLFGTLTAKVGKGDELLAILLEASQLVSKAKGCQIYAVAKEIENQDTIKVFEVWDTQEDHDLSLQDEDVRALIGKAIPLLEGQPSSGIKLEIHGGKGV